MVFVARDAFGDFSLWSTAGSPADTFEIFDPCPTPCEGSGPIQSLGGTDALVYFLASDLQAGPGRINLFRSDGTTEGTFALLEPEMAQHLSNVAHPDNYTIAGSRLFFRLVDGFQTYIGSTTGSPSATRIEFTAPVSPGFAATICASDDRSIFVRYRDPAEGDQLLRIGALPLRLDSPVSLGNLIAHCDSARIVGDAILFAATDLLGEWGVWAANAPDGPLRLLKASSAFPRILEADGDIAFFQTSIGPDLVPVLWSTDGTADHTYALKTGTRFESLIFGTKADQIARTGDIVFYLYRTDDDRIELRRVTWRGEADMEVALVCTVGCSGSSVPYFVERLGEDVVASAQSPPSATSLYRFVAGGAQFDDVAIPCGTPCVVDHSLAHVDGSLLFQVQADTEGADLWRLAMGTNVAERVTAFDLATGLSPHVLELDDLVLVNEKLYFEGRESNQESPLAFAASLRSPCEGLSRRSLCINGQRFRLNIQWRDFTGGEGVGVSQAFSENSGFTVFFDEANVELVTKIVDGSSLNGHHWVYYGALSNVEYDLRIEDTTNGFSRLYHNPLGEFGSVGDIEALPASTSGDRPSAMTSQATRSESGDRSRATGGATCFPSATRACLLGDRFAVEGEWRNFVGESGSAFTTSVTSDTGILWFFDPNVVEIVVKLVDGSAFNDRFWVYFGSLSNVEFTLTVTDTVTGESKPYFNPLGSFGSFGDIDAFPAP